MRCLHSSFNTTGVNVITTCQRCRCRCRPCQRLVPRQGAHKRSSITHRMLCRRSTRHKWRAVPQALPLTLGVLLCLLALDPRHHATVVATGRAPRLPAAPPQYNEIGGLDSNTIDVLKGKPINFNKERFWTIQQLDNVHLTSAPSQFVPLLEKLDRGEGITVLAFGSSVTANMGGKLSCARQQ